MFEEISKEEKIKALQEFFGVSKREAKNQLIDMGEIPPRV